MRKVVSFLPFLDITKVTPWGEYTYRTAAAAFEFHGQDIVPVDFESLPAGPLEPERHATSCLCVECWNAGVRYADWLKAKMLEL